MKIERVKKENNFRNRVEKKDTDKRSRLSVA